MRRLGSGEVIFVNGIRVIEWCCRCCGGIYTKHLEHKNVCPHCGADFGFAITPEELSKGLRDKFKDFV